MKKIKVADATNEKLNWLVAKCEGHAVNGPYPTEWVFCLREPDGSDGDAIPEYSTDWTQGGPIVERMIAEMGLRLMLNDHPQFEDDKFVASVNRPMGFYFGPTPLIAAMRCYVASKLGTEVEVPEALV